MDKQLPKFTKQDSWPLLKLIHAQFMLHNYCPTVANPDKKTPKA